MTSTRPELPAELRSAYASADEAMRLLNGRPRARFVPAQNIP